jgi:hypothetical protein
MVLEYLIPFWPDNKESSLLVNWFKNFTKAIIFKIKINYDHTLLLHELERKEYNYQSSRLTHIPFYEAIRWFDLLFSKKLLTLDFQLSIYTFLKFLFSIWEKELESQSLFKRIVNYLKKLKNLKITPCFFRNKIQNQAIN